MWTLHCFFLISHLCFPTCSLTHSPRFCVQALYPIPGTLCLFFTTWCVSAFHSFQRPADPSSLPQSGLGGLAACIFCNGSCHTTVFYSSCDCVPHCSMSPLTLETSLSASQSSLAWPQSSLQYFSSWREELKKDSKTLSVLSLIGDV